MENTHYDTDTDNVLGITEQDLEWMIHKGTTGAGHSLTAERLSLLRQLHENADIHRKRRFELAKHLSLVGITVLSIATPILAASKVTEAQAMILKVAMLAIGAGTYASFRQLRFLSKWEKANLEALQKAYLEYRLFPLAETSWFERNCEAIALWGFWVALPLLFLSCLL